MPPLKAVSLADVAAERQIMLSLDEIHETAEAFWRDHGLRPTVAFRTRSVEAVRSLVATGAGIAVLPDLVYRPWSLEGDRIEARPMVEPLPPVRVGVVWRRGSRLSEAASRFLDVVCRASRALSYRHFRYQAFEFCICDGAGAKAHFGSSGRALCMRPGRRGRRARGEIPMNRGIETGDRQRGCS